MEAIATAIATGLAQCNCQRNAGSKEPVRSAQRADLSTEQIDELCQEVISQFGGYNLIRNTCQDFVQNTCDIILEEGEECKMLQTFSVDSEKRFKTIHRDVAELIQSARGA